MEEIKKRKEKIKNKFNELIEKENNINTLHGLEDDLNEWEKLLE